MIPVEAVEAAKTAMETVTPPPGVSKAEWLAEHGRFALIAGAVAAAAPYIRAQALEDAADKLAENANPTPQVYAMWLRIRAAFQRGQE